MLWEFFKQFQQKFSLKLIRSSMDYSRCFFVNSTTSIIVISSSSSFGNFPRFATKILPKVNLQILLVMPSHICSKVNPGIFPKFLPIILCDVSQWIIPRVVPEILQKLLPRILLEVPLEILPNISTGIVLYVSLCNICYIFLEILTENYLGIPLKNQ